MPSHPAQHAYPCWNNSSIAIASLACSTSICMPAVPPSTARIAHHTSHVRRFIYHPVSGYVRPCHLHNAVHNDDLLKQWLIWNPRRGKIGWSQRKETRESTCGIHCGLHVSWKSGGRALTDGCFSRNKGFATAVNVIY